jgi:hypothetical protein
MKIGMVPRAAPRCFAAGLALWLAVIIPSVAASEDERLTFFRIGTGPTAETLYALGTAISAGISRPPGSSPCDQGGVCGVPGLIAVAQSKGGSIENLEALAEGDLESALVHADMAYWAYNAAGPFKHRRPFTALRVIANLTPVSMHIVVPAESGIRAIQDLKGKRVSLGPSGSGTVSNALLLMRTHGLSLEEFRPRFLNPGPASDQLASGEIDALFEIGGEPIEAVAALAERMPIRLIPIGGYPARQMQSLYPFLSAGVIRDGLYNGVPETATLSLGVQWVTRSEEPSGLVESITRALWQGNSRELYLIDNPDSRFPTLEEAARESAVPMHAGAKVYYDQVTGS